MAPNYGALLFHIQFLFRRLVLVLLAFGMEDYPAIQILVFTVCTLFTMIYLAFFKPFYHSFQDKLELFNEVIIMMIIEVYATLSS